MMSVAAFDTHKYAKQLAKAGVPDEQVEAQVAALAKALQSGFEEILRGLDSHPVGPNLEKERISTPSEAVRSLRELRREMQQMDMRQSRHMRDLLWMCALVLVGTIAIHVQLCFLPAF